MEHSFIVDNDSGYVSHNQESNMDSSYENVHKLGLYSSYNEFQNEDTLLERPYLKQTSRSNSFTKHSDSFDSVINSSQESVKTTFSGFEDSFASDTSFVIPEVPPIIWKNDDAKENISQETVALNPNILKETNCESLLKLTTNPHKVLANVTNIYEQNSSQIVIKNTSSDKENINPSETPKKAYKNRLTSDISPDLFADEEINTSFESRVKEKSPMAKSALKENYCLKDLKMLRNIQSSLSGVHPPPSITTVQMNVTEMLERIHKNKDLFWNVSSTVTDEKGKCLLVDDNPDCVQLPWPSILKAKYHGLHYNRNRISEEIEYLCLKYAERYVGADTQSSCTVFDSDPPCLQKRKILKPRWGSKSPGRRLSHLARRRITFSSSNLQASSSSAILGSRARQILVDARKLSLLKKSPKKSPRKTPSKSPFKIRKNTPSSSAKKKLAMRFRQMSGEFENMAPGTSSEPSVLSFKRALFSNEKDNGTFGGSLEKKSTKRALFSSPLKNSPNKKSPLKTFGLEKKRKRTDNDTSNPPKLSRSMSFEPHSQKSDSSFMFNRTLSENFTSKPEELSEQHKKKLQWAVYESLRLQKVTPSHPHYKIFASVLARVTRKFLPSLRFEGRTTEKMFRIARYHSYAVVKGKSVDEIVNDYVKNKMKNLKPHGYVGIEEVRKIENERNSTDKENILQDKMNIIESIEKRKEQVGSKTRFLSQNRIDQIKKVIRFEEKEA